MIASDSGRLWTYVGAAQSEEVATIRVDFERQRTRPVRCADIRLKSAQQLEVRRMRRPDRVGDRVDIAHLRRPDMTGSRRPPPVHA